MLNKLIQLYLIVISLFIISCSKPNNSDTQNFELEAIVRSTNCNICGGSGIIKCGTCNGSGENIKTDYGWLTDGETKIEFEKCTNCKGEGSFTCSRCNGCGKILVVDSIK